MYMSSISVFGILFINPKSYKYEKEKSTLRTAGQQPSRSAYRFSSVLCTDVSPNAKYALSLAVNHIRQLPQGESPFKCSYCAKSFTRKEHLTNHVRQHTGESPYRCPYCGKTFTRKEHLTNHVRWVESPPIHPSPMKKRKYITTDIYPWSLL